MFPNKPGLKSKLSKLPKQQQAELFKWLTSRDGCTYEKAISLLKERFGVSATLSQLHSFYHGHCLPKIHAKRKPDEILLDVVLKRRGAGGWQIMVLRHSPGVALYGHRNLQLLAKRERDQ